MQVQLVKAAGGEILPDGAGAACDRHGLIAGGGLGLAQRRGDAVRDESESGAAQHRQRLARLVSEYENLRVVRRLVAPPTLPLLVPGSGTATEHLSTHAVGADALDQLVEDL